MSTTLRTKPLPVDLADAWLGRALDHLLDACAAQEHNRSVDASRATVVFASLAVESRINRLVREHDPERWPAESQLTPLEKFQLVPRLLHESELARHNELAELVVEVFDLRDDLVGAGPCASSFDPHTACVTLAAAAEICRFLDADDEVAASVRVSAESLKRSAGTAPPPLTTAEWGDFPPDIGGS
jgi:hypothetical protein